MLPGFEPWATTQDTKGGGSNLRTELIALVMIVLATQFEPGDAGSTPHPLQLRVAENRKPLRPSAMYPLPLGAIKPRGWLRRQLQIQAEGLTGHLDEFWPDVGPNSGWLGGTGESWERGPYFVDGLVPLAYLLDDANLIAKAKRWIEWTLVNQRPDGGIGPRKNTDWWPNMVMLKALAQYHEATGDDRVITAMERYFQHHLKLADERPLKQWAIYRWGDELLSVLWLYNRTGEGRLLELAHKLKAQGFDWNRHFQEFEYRAKVTKEQLGAKPTGSMSAHGVNNSMAMKTPALWWLVSGDEADRKAVFTMFEQLDTYHLLPNGMHSADEHYAGTNPSQGVELCAVVEAMFSLQHLIAVLGDAGFGDRLERITFNALPATFSADMWAHQYDQQPNQVLCSIHPRDWTTNGPESNIFGLEPNFGCCTANMHQGWPKFVGSMWMATADGGLAAVAYSPCELNTVVKGGTRVRIVEETEYPFEGHIRFTIDTSEPVSFPLLVRIPGWAQGARIRVNGEPYKSVRAGAFHAITRRWKRGDRVVLTLPLMVRLSRWYRDSVAVERGPLVFSLKIGEDWRKLERGIKKPAPPPAADWEVHPTSPWNYALALDPVNPARLIRVIERPVAQWPFSARGAPVELRVRGRRLSGWELVNGSAGPLPQSPVKSAGPEETITLIPYGSAKLRITAFPLLSD